MFFLKLRIVILLHKTVRKFNVYSLLLPHLFHHALRNALRVHAELF